MGTPSDHYFRLIAIGTDSPLNPRSLFSAHCHRPIPRGLSHMSQQFYGPLTYGRYLGMPIHMAVSRYGSPPKNCHLSAELAVGLKLTIKEKTRDVEPTK